MLTKVVVGFPVTGGTNAIYAKVYQDTQTKENSVFHEALIIHTMRP